MRHDGWRIDRDRRVWADRSGPRDAVGAGRYEVTLGACSVASAALVNVPDPVRVGTFEDAARHDVVVLAVRHDGAPDVATRLAPPRALRCWTR